MTQAHWGQIQVLWDGGHGWRTRGCRKPWSLSPSLGWAPGSGGVGTGAAGTMRAFWALHETPGVLCAK